MKGKATIILADARTGEVVSRTEEHNLVTNALNNIFAPPHYAMLHNFKYSSLFSGGLPLWKDLAAGIMLLGNTVEEDADNILLGSDTIPVGTAGGEYDGDNIWRGTLNLNETYQTENGYHFTWDFGTDKCNGTIKCVALTSKEFGNAGFHSGTETDGSFTVNPMYIGQTDVDPDIVLEYGTGQYLGTFESGIHTFAELDENSNIVFRRYHSVDPDALKINDVTGLTSVSEPISVNTVTPGVAVKYEERFFVDPKKRLVYYFGDSVQLSDTQMQICWTAISLDTFTVAETKSVVIPKRCTNQYIGAVWGGYLYYLTSEGVSKFTLGGELIKDYEAPFEQYTIFFALGDCLMAQVSGGDIYCFSWGDESCRVNFGKYLFPAYNIDAKAPYMSICRRRYHYAGDASVTVKPLLTMAGCYMATINNLSQPIEKTSAYTLKISYDIIN